MTHGDIQDVDLFLSTPSARRATRTFRDAPRALQISIHALREEGDRGSHCAVRPRSYFYPRPPRGGRQPMVRSLPYISTFLSTPSARRATLGRYVCMDKFSISIHALREEGDRFRNAERWAARGFLSTPSARRATLFAFRVLYLLFISIHALREEGDPTQRIEYIGLNKFLSTPSARRATGRLQRSHRDHQISIHALREEGDATLLRIAKAQNISIHALREEGDIRRPGNAGAVSDFYPRPPRGGRPCPQYQRYKLELFLSTPSARRATSMGTKSKRAQSISIHALREEGDPADDLHLETIILFLSTPSARRATSCACWDQAR